MSTRDWIDPTRLYNPNLPASRLVYLWGGYVLPMGTVFMVAICAGITEASLGYYEQSPIYDLVSTLLGIGYFIAMILITLRRLKDLGKSGWYILWGLVPFANFIFGLWLLFAPGAVLQQPGPSISTATAFTPPASQISGPQAPIGIAPDGAHTPVRFRPKCGSQLAESAQYCMACGSRIPNTSTSS